MGGLLGPDYGGTAGKVAKLLMTPRGILEATEENMELYASKRGEPPPESKGPNAKGSDRGPGRRRNARVGRENLFDDPDEPTPNE